MPVAMAKRAFNNDPHCGDQAGYWRSGSQISLCIVDGLGHGQFAETAAKAALDYVARHLREPLPDIFAGCNVALRHSRGVAMGMAVIDEAAETLAYAGIGNTRAMIVRGEATENLPHPNPNTFQISPPGPPKGGEISEIPPSGGLGGPLNTHIHERTPYLKGIDPNPLPLGGAGGGRFTKKTVTLSSHPGIVGGGYRKLVPETVPFGPGDRLFLFTDGLPEIIDFSGYSPEVWADTQRLAEKMIGDWGRRTDDAAVLVY